MSALEEQPLNETVSSMEIVSETSTLENEPEEMIEEAEADETMRDLDELVKIKEKLLEDNTQYELHIQFIELLKKLDFKDELEAARVAMHDVYPLSEELWLDWIQDAKAEATEEDGEIKLLGLYDQAQEDYFSLAIWKDYVEYKIDRFNQIFTAEIDELDETMEAFIDTYREDLLKAVRAASAHIKSSQEVWKRYSEFELNILARFKTEDQVEFVRKMYLTRLGVLHIDCEDTFNAYSSFISTYDNSNYEQSMVNANKIYAKTKVAVEDRDFYELQLTTSGYALDTFYKYIEHEKTTKLMFSLNNVRALYERAILIYCTDASLWDDYILFLIEKARVQVFLESTCLRATRNCPWSGVLWSHLTRIMESGEKENSLIEDVFERALKVKAIRANVDEFVTILLGFCDYSKRQIGWEDRDTFYQVMETVLNNIKEAFPKSGDPLFRIEKLYAYIALRKFGDVEKTREIWESVVQQHGRNTEAWINYILFERDQDNHQKCSTLFKQAIQKNIDNPTRLIEVWTMVEHEIGTLKSYEEALVKINVKNKILSKQWANYAAQEVIKEEKKSEEKKLMDRKKKSAHRLAQKQRAKEKKNKHHESTSTESTPIESTPIEHTPIESTPIEHTPIESAPTESAPSESTPTESTAVTSELNSVEAPKSDDDVFKKPFLPNRTNEEGSSLKRKLSSESDQQEEVKKLKTSTSFRPRAVRGRKTLKLGQRAVSKNDAVTTSNEPSTSEDKPRSNDDFRAMLLGKK